MVGFLTFRVFKKMFKKKEKHIINFFKIINFRKKRMPRTRKSKSSNVQPPALEKNVNRCLPRKLRLPRQLYTDKLAT